jgi:hypothetical protein
MVRRPGTVGGRRTQVLSGVLPDPAGKTGHQLDVVVFGRDSGGAERIIAIGEAKNHAVVGETGQPARPDPGSAGSARPSRGAADEITALHRKRLHPGTLGRGGFRDDVELVDLERLYRGDWFSVDCRLALNQSMVRADRPKIAGRSGFVWIEHEQKADLRAAARPRPELLQVAESAVLEGFAQCWSDDR